MGHRGAMAPPAGTRKATDSAAQGGKASAARRGNPDPRPPHAATLQRSPHLVRHRGLGDVCLLEKKKVSNSTGPRFLFSLYCAGERLYLRNGWVFYQRIWATHIAYNALRSYLVGFVARIPLIPVSENAESDGFIRLSDSASNLTPRHR